MGLGRATIRATRGLRYSVTRLIVPPLPAASRPSKTTTSRTPSARTHSWSFTNSVWSRYNSRSYGPRGTFVTPPGFAFFLPANVSHLSHRVHRRSAARTSPARARP